MKSLRSTHFKAPLHCKSAFISATNYYLRNRSTKINKDAMDTSHNPPVKFSGGTIGLFMGMSFVSVIEAIYWIYRVG